MEEIEILELYQKVILHTCKKDQNTKIILERNEMLSIHKRNKNIEKNTKARDQRKNKLESNS